MSKGIKKISENVILDGRALTLTNGLITDNGVFPIGTLRCNPTTKGLEFKAGENTFNKFDAAELLGDGSIIERLIATDAVTTNKIKNYNITTNKLADLSVTTQKLANLAVTEAKISNEAVTESKLAINSVSTSKLKDRSVTAIKIALKGVEEENYNDESVSTRALANASVTNTKLATNSVLTKHVKDLNITHEKLATGSVHGEVIPNKGIVTTHLNDDSVTTIKLANGAVTTAKIEDKQITEIKLADLSVSTRALINESVTNAKLADNSVGTSNIIDKSVTNEKLSQPLQNTLRDAVLYEGNDVNLRGNLHVKANIIAEGDIEGARVLNAVYMDLAEAYIPGEKLEPGDIVEMREDGKVYKATWRFIHDTAIVGVVSDEYAACYGATKKELENGSKIAVGLIGKVHVKVDGPCKLGMKIMVGKNGTALASSNCGDRKIGKCLETSNKEGVNKVLCLIYPN